MKKIFIITILLITVGNLSLPSVLKFSQADEIVIPGENNYTVDDSTSVHLKISENLEKLTSKKVRGVGWVKKAIQLALKNKKLLVEAVNFFGGKKNAKIVEKNIKVVEKSLKPLLGWTDVPLKAVQDAVFRGLRNAGIKETEARSVAMIVKEALSWIV